MLLHLKEMIGHTLTASDGDIGKIREFYFDDQTWAIRYLVADTGTWLTGRKVLLSPYSFGRFSKSDQTMHVNLTRKQIENSPSIDTQRPVSRQYEENYYSYYGWPVYWVGGEVWGKADYPGRLASTTPGNVRTYDYPRWDEVHLASSKTVTGYALEATDGAIGSVSDFLVDDKRWVIREIAIETGHWYSGKEVLMLPSKVQRINYPEAKVFVDLSKDDIKQTAENHLARASV